MLFDVEDESVEVRDDRRFEAIEVRYEGKLVKGKSLFLDRYPVVRKVYAFVSFLSCLLHRPEPQRPALQQLQQININSMNPIIEPMAIPAI